MTAGSRLLLAIAALAAAGTLLSPPLVGGAPEVPITHRVLIENFRFVPERIEIRPGDRVEWVNRDIAPHTATDVDGRWGTEELGRDDAGTVAFTDAGSFDYRCAFHPDMRGSVVVVSP